MRRVLIVAALFFPAMLHAVEEKESVGGVSTTTEEAAGAKPSPFGNTTANVGLTTDYNYRGQSLTGHQPAIQGGLDWNHPIGFYLGAWGSNVHFQDSPAALELDVYGGYNYTVSPSLTLGTGVLVYTYYRGADANTLEIPFQVGWKSVKVALSYSPHWGGGDAGSAWYMSAAWSSKVLWETTLALNAGYSIFAPELGFDNYADFHLGVSREMLGITWDVSGYAVSHQQFNGNDDPEAVFSISKSI